MKNVLITGCSSGFGLAMANTFLKNGWNVIAGVRSMDELPEDLLLAASPNLTIQKIDLTEKEDILSAKMLIQRKFQNELHCLVNNAGYMLVGPLEKLEDVQILNEMQVNFLGHVLLTQACLPALRKSQGKIINISSALGYSGLPLHSLYCASKFALEGFSESLYYELKPLGVQVALIEPGIHRSKIFENIDFGSKDNSSSQANTYANSNTNNTSENTNTNPHSNPEALACHIYQQQEMHLKRFKDKVQKNPYLGAPLKLAKVVYQLAEKRTMPLRTRVGIDASMLYYFQRFLPKSVSQWFLGNVYHKIFLG